MGLHTFIGQYPTGVQQTRKTFVSLSTNISFSGKGSKARMLHKGG